jgi:lipid-A-disaccharide synthase
LIALAPGSRRQEIDYLLPTMLQTARLLRQRFPQAAFFLPLAATVAREQVEGYMRDSGLDVEIVSEQPLAARAAADLAIVSSGTATLETALLGVPMIIGYRMHPFSYFLARIFVRLSCFGLANLVAEEKIAPEFLQREFNAYRLTETAAEILSRPELAEAQRRGWKKVREKVGGPGAIARAAEAILDVMGSNQ